MAGQDYVPLYKPGCSVTCTAAAAITAGQLVEISAGTLIPGTPPLGTPVVSGGVPNSASVTPSVTPTTAATAAQVGVAANSVPSGGTLAVWFDGVHTLATAATIAAGDPVVAAASGEVADLGTDTPGTSDYAKVIGHAWSASADGVVIVRLNV